MFLKNEMNKHFICFVMRKKKLFGYFFIYENKYNQRGVTNNALQNYKLH